MLKRYDSRWVNQGNRIDVSWKPQRECYNWGRRNVKVYILDIK